MTLAICLECGGEKRGALTPCAACGFTPSTEEERARSMLLSDRHMTSEQLATNGALISSGAAPDLGDAPVDEMAALIRENPDLLEMPLGCRIAVWIPLVVLIILLVVVGALYFMK